MLEKIKNKLYKALLCALTPKVSLQKYFNRKLKEGEALLSQDALKKANEATSAAVGAAKPIEVKEDKPKPKKWVVPVSHERSSVSLKGISITDPRAGARIVNAVSKTAMDQNIAGSINTSIYLEVISKQASGAPPGMVRVTRRINLSDEMPDGSRVATATISVDMYSLSNFEKREYTHVTSFANVGNELPVSSGLAHSFAMFHIASEYECFQTLRGFYGADFPFEKYNKDVNDNAIDLYARAKGNQKKYQIKEVIELAVDHSKPAALNHMKIVATIEGLTDEPVEIAYGEVMYAKV